MTILLLLLLLIHVGFVTDFAESQVLVVVVPLLVLDDWNMDDDSPGKAL
jgi:hypothetical protein